VLASVAVTVAATPPPVAGPAVAQAMSRPSGTGVVWWGPQHYVHVTFRLSHLQPGTTYPLGLFSAPCGQSATLLDAFPGVDPTSTGTSSQTIYSRSPLANGVPAGTSLRLGSPVPRDTDSSVNAAVGLGCADIGRPISTVNGSESITVS